MHTMAAIPRMITSRYLSLIVIMFCLVSTFFFLLNNVQTARNAKIVDLPSARRLRLPGEFSKYLKPKASGSYCKMNFGLPTQLAYAKNNISGTPELKESSEFRILYNVIESQLGDEDPGVTYVTQLTKEFVLYLAEIVRYWEGAVSVAVYIPDGNPKDILQSILHFCYCIPQMSRLSLHLVFKKDSEPSFYLSKPMPPQTCEANELTRTSINSNSSRDTKPHDPTNWYPINVCRNAAREAAKTDFVLVSDIELMPSKGLASRFIDMTESYKCEAPNCKKRIFVVPVFEVDSKEDLPRNKRQLVNLMRDHKAVYFHQLTCVHCQKFPGLDQWKESEPGDIIKPLLETKREIPYHRWEPIYIGTRTEPIYSEKLSWEGFQDKMLQMYEMCLNGYTVVLLDGAFLVHWPGIKTAKRKDEPWRVPYVKKNQDVYNEMLEKIHRKYSKNPKCGEQKPS
ncbi:hypothetical protein HUJ04_009728 [Dendroctonus ponderosae]|nr:hypothetical protein HUJ04_009728 [Dendroctonus ponderosae]KAH1019996.1 hypothetical protein HUJ04_009728 [Dendroctonus ponderosae]